MDFSQLSCGAVVYPSKVITHPKGDIFHGVKASDRGFVGFGEAYFTLVDFGAIKGWKKHRQMSMNLLVPKGSVRFHLQAEGSDTVEHVTLGEKSYFRLFVPPGIWMAFEGMSSDTNLLMNLASIEHDPSEAVTKDFTS